MSSIWLEECSLSEVELGETAAAVRITIGEAPGPLGRLKLWFALASQAMVVLHVGQRGLLKPKLLTHLIFVMHSQMQSP
jgi:hypothetical protein